MPSFSVRIAYGKNRGVYYLQEHAVFSFLDIENNDKNYCFHVDVNFSRYSYNIQLIYHKLFKDNLIYVVTFLNLWMIGFWLHKMSNYWRTNFSHKMSFITSYRFYLHEQFESEWKISSYFISNLFAIQINRIVGDRSYGNSDESAWKQFAEANRSDLFITLTDKILFKW